MITIIPPYVHPSFPVPWVGPVRLLTKFSLQFIINASQPASDKIFDVSAFEKFLNEKIKVEGRVGNLGDTIQISQQGDGKIEIIAHNELSGRYLKYLYAPVPPTLYLNTVCTLRTGSRMLTIAVS